MHQTILAGGMAVLLGAALAGTAVATTQTPTANAAGTVAVTVSVTDDTRSVDLAYSRDEERMARDLYTLFAQTYDAAIFVRIAASEQLHFEAVGGLLTTYGVSDPATGQPAGTYTSPDVQQLYEQWKVRGLTSIQDAYAVGVALEQTDIADLEELLARSTDADVQQVFTHLLAASHHHLTAFTNAVNGGTDVAFCNRTGAQPGARGDGRGMGDGTGMGAGYRMGRNSN